MADEPDVAVDEGASPDEIQAVREVLQDFDLDWPVVEYITRSAGEVVGAILLGNVLTPFFVKFGQNAADDLYKQIKAFLARLFAARKSKEVQVTVIDDHIWIVIDREISEEALRRLYEIDRRTVAGQSQTLVWNKEAGDWQSPWPTDRGESWPTQGDGRP